MPILYPAQTSMMPVNIALARFLESEGLGAIFSNYPYWYLGSTPFRYLIGPILPLNLTFIHRLFPNLSLFDIFFFLTAFSFFLGGAGLYFLVKELKGRGRAAIFTALFYLFGPIVPFLFRFSDGLYLIAFSALPFILFFYLKFLKKPSRRLKASLVALITFALLIDTLIIPSLFLGMATIFLTQVGWKKVEAKLKSSFVLLFFSFLVATLWYTPGYWLTLLGAPSFGGRGLAQAMVWLGKLLPTALALTLAVFSVKFFKKRNLLRDFCFYWLFIFGFLTLMRFLSDPDFWLDWIAYGVELQFGLAVLGGLVVGHLFEKQKYQTVNSKNQINILKIKNFLYLLCIFTIHLLIFTIVFTKYALGTLQKDITETVEYKISNQLSELIKPEERPVDSSTDGDGVNVFLSGTTGFWLNAFFDIPQVRGGRDQASIDANWREATWEIREGVTTEGTEKWLKILKISYLVVHTQDSEEYYHDFRYPVKFEAVRGLTRVFEEKGDRLYRVE